METESGCFLSFGALTQQIRTLQGKRKNSVRACLHGGGRPQVGEVTRLGGVIRLSM